MVIQRPVGAAGTFESDSAPVWYLFIAADGTKQEKLQTDPPFDPPLVAGLPLEGDAVDVCTHRASWNFKLSSTARAGTIIQQIAAREVAMALRQSQPTPSTSSVCYQVLAELGSSVTTTHGESPMQIDYLLCHFR